MEPGRFSFFRQRNRPLPPLTVGRGAELSTLAARGMVVEAVVHEPLRVGEARLREVPAVLVDARDGSPPASDGLLPLHLFDRVTVDGPGGVIVLEGH